MTGNRALTLASLSQIPYRCHICNFAQKKAKNNDTSNAKPRGSSNDHDLQVFFQRWTVESQTNIPAEAKDSK